MYRRSLSLLLVLSGLCLPFYARADVRLPPIFSDHMVLQRSADVPVWGKADPGEKVTVSVAGKTARAAAGTNGAWRVTLNLKKADAGPHIFVVAGRNRIEIQDVVIGEVWLCGGQSNAGMPMWWDATSKEEIPRSSNMWMRTYQMDTGGGAFEPGAEQPAGKWIVAAPAVTPNFWVPGYFFAKNLQQALQVPVGYIATAKGNSPIEDWMSEAALSGEPHLRQYREGTLWAWNNFDRLHDEFFKAQLEWQRQFGREDKKANPQVIRIEGVPTWRNAIASDPVRPEACAAPEVNDADWKTVKMPAQAAEVGLPSSGALWIRKTINVPADKAGKDLSVSMPGTEAVVFCFNGKQIGYNHPRPIGGWGYTAPGALVKEGANVVCFRLFSPDDKLGFFVKDTYEMKAGEQPLAGDWKAKMEFELPRLPDDARAALDKLPPFPNKPTPPGLSFNATIHPLAPYAIRGFTWYQGETGGGYFYREAFKRMIADWRALWKQPDLPFYFCQLPNYNAKAGGPVENGAWAVTRESQAEGLKLPHTGMAVLIDLGEANNLHPHKKKEVGDRLAALALAQTYGKSIPYSGPMLESVAIEGKRIRLKFRHVDGGLVAQPLPKEYPLDLTNNSMAPLTVPNPDSQVQGFALCGKDGAWVFGNARIDGDTVIVESPHVPEPAAVRYAWADNPTCNLYNGAGFPAAPFRTDTFPLPGQGATPHFP